MCRIAKPAGRPAGGLQHFYFTAWDHRIFYLPYCPKLSVRQLMYIRRDAFAMFYPAIEA